MEKQVTRVLASMIGLAGLAVLAWSAAPEASLDNLRSSFVDPPANARIMMRWWWFGTAVTKPELARELQAMKTGGIGGVEIQPVYPLALDDPQTGLKNLPYLSPEFLDAVRFTSDKARELGLRVDMTLCSGWPYGGPHVPVTQAAGALRLESVEITPGVDSVPLPDLANGESLITAFLARSRPHPEPPVSSRRGHPTPTVDFIAEGMRQISDVKFGRLQIPAGLDGPHVVMFFISGRTGMQVKRAAVGAEGFVLDHYDRAAIDSHLKMVGDTLMQAFGDHPPYAVFSDSLEDFGSDWTPDLLTQFRERRGYDLTPYLPALVGDIGEKTAAIRHDWGQTLTELADERYLTPISEWAHQHHTRFRSQTYGVPPVILSSNALVDLPEGEAGPHWRGFSPARWASSASHLYGRPVTSTETWTWLHSPAFRATLLDMKAEADLHFIEGINQLIGHGWPYSPPSAGEPGWRFYASAVFNNHNPWWIVMPEITKYLQRMSFLMRQGQPDNDIAIYLPTDDVWSTFTRGQDSVDRSMDAAFGPDLIPQILNSGYNFDFIDDIAIAKVGIGHKILILPSVHSIPLATYQKLQAFVQSGGILVATRRTPSIAPGMMNGPAQTPQIAEISHSLFEGGKAHLIEDEHSLGTQLASLLTPDFATADHSPTIGFIHRKLVEGDIYFAANTSNRAVHTTVAARVTGLEAEVWDAFTGASYSLSGSLQQGVTNIPLDLEPYESRVFLFSKHANAKTPLPSLSVASSTTGSLIDLNSNWKVSFPAIHEPSNMAILHSWADDPDTRYFSGVATYERTVSIPETLLKSRLILSFGSGVPLESDQGNKPGMRAWIEGPVREVGLVYINGHSAGSVWRPPYSLDVTKCVHAGENTIRIEVANTAINELAGQDLPTYRLLNLRYGERFTPQDMNNLKPLPSGLLGPVVLGAQ